MLNQHLIRDDNRICELSLMLEQTGMSLEQVAEAIGDSSSRLSRVSEGTEPLGRTAALAILARLHNLPEIEKGD